MADQEQLSLLKRDQATWNWWRQQNPDQQPDLSRADLYGCDLHAADLSEANLSQGVPQLFAQEMFRQKER